MSTLNGLVGTDFDPVETVVSSEESIRDSVDFQEEEYCEEVEQDDGDDQEPDNSSSCNKMAATPTKSISSSDPVPSSATNGYQSMPGTPGAIGHQEFWDMFTGLKVKQYSDQELEAFKGPFLKGWRREVVLRGTVTNSGKKIGDVYYYSPDKKTKLRSYVEMGLFLKKNSGCGLEPENFTFARQPVYKPPEEIVRHAMTRGSNQPPDHMGSSPPEAAVSSIPVVAAAPAEVVPVPVSPAASSKPQVVTRRSQSNASSVDPVTPETPDTSLLAHEGRSKRKRVAPTRFEDEEYLDNSPFKKKSEKPAKTEKPISSLASAAAPALKSVETKVNAQGRPSLIIRTPAIRKVAAAVAPAASESKAQIQVQNPVSANTKSASADTKEKEVMNNQPLGFAPESSDSEMTAAGRSEERPASNTDPVVQVNGSHQKQQQMNPAPPPLQPILQPMAQAAASPAAIIPQTGVRKEVRPAAAVVTPQNQQSAPPNMRKVSGQNKSGRSILTSNSNQHRVVNETGSSFKPIRPKPAPRIAEPEDISTDGTGDDMGMVPPCSIMCGGGQLPSQFCSRCLCLFHPQCVQRGILVNHGNQFICPNCIQPSDKGQPIGLVNGSHETESGVRSAPKTQPSSQNSSRCGSPLLTSSSLIRKHHVNSNPKSHSVLQNHHVNQSKETISTMMDKRQKSQLQLLQTFQQIAGIRSKNAVSSRPVISRPVPLVKKQQIVQNRGHLRLAAAAVGRDARHLLLPISRTSQPKPRLLPQQQQHPPQLHPAPVLQSSAAPVPTAGHHQHLSELISHHLESVSKLLQEITMLKYSNCQKASTNRPQRRKRSHSV